MAVSVSLAFDPAKHAVSHEEYKETTKQCYWCLVERKTGKGTDNEKLHTCLPGGAIRRRQRA